MCRIDDCEPAHDLGGGERKARKEHRCDDCRRTIRPGESYRWARWLYDGDFTSAKMCAHCWAARVWVEKACGGYVWTQVGEELREHWDEEEPLRSFTLARLVLSHRRRWTRRDGTLMPIPDEGQVLASVPESAAA